MRLPGFTPRERKSEIWRPLARSGDLVLLRRCACRKGCGLRAAKMGRGKERVGGGGGKVVAIVGVDGPVGWWWEEVGQVVVRAFVSRWWVGNLELRATFRAEALDFKLKFGGAGVCEDSIVHHI